MEVGQAIGNILDADLIVVFGIRTIMTGVELNLHRAFFNVVKYWIVEIQTRFGYGLLKPHMNLRRANPEKHIRCSSCSTTALLRHLEDKLWAMYLTFPSPYSISASSRS